MRSKRKIINLFEDENIFSIKYVISIDKEDDLNQFWDFLGHSNNSSHCLLHSFISQFYNFALNYMQRADAKFFEIILEENNHNFYFTLWNEEITLLFKDHVEKTSLPFKHKKNRISIKLVKEKCAEEIQEIKAHNTAREAELLNSVKSKVIIEKKEPYKFISNDDLEELMSLNDDLQEYIYQINKSSLDEQLFISIRSALSMFCLTLRYYTQISPIANTLTQFSNLMNTHKNNFMNLDKLQVELISGFINNIDTWLQTLFIKGGADIYFMDNSIQADFDTIKPLIVGFSVDDTDLELDMDTIFF